MEENKKTSLEEAGWVTGDYAEFLKLTPEEANAVNMAVHKARLDEDYLAYLETLDKSSTPYPWYPRYGDDDVCMNARWVSTESSKSFDYLYQQKSTSVVAITFLQSPRLADINDVDDNNMYLICEYREAVPLLVAEIRRLREELKAKEKQ